jgi:hypothetical protein
MQSTLTEQNIWEQSGFVVKLENDSLKEIFVFTQFQMWLFSILIND